MDSVPVTGLAHTAVTVEYRKEGGSFVSKVLSAPIWTELGDGVYTVSFTTAELNTLGSFTVKVKGATIDQYVDIAYVVAAGIVSSAPTVTTCVLNGSVVDLTGAPVADAVVTARILGMPAIEQNVAIADDDVAVKTDANGEFLLTLARLAEVEIVIPVANYRRRITVPNAASANLFTGVV